MIQEYIDILQAAKVRLIGQFKEERPSGYEELFECLISLIADNSDEYDSPDPKLITVIDHGHYQGTILFIVGAGGYQPSKYWACKVHYGSCSGCDTFQANRDYGDEITDREAEGNWTMMLHMAQGLKEI